MPEFYFRRMTRITLMSLFLLALTGCKKENQLDHPLVVTGEIMKVTSKGAEFQGRITGNTDGIIDHGFVWDLHDEPLIGNGYQRSLGPLVSADFSILTEAAFRDGVFYYVRAYARNSQNTIYGRTAVFKSLGGTAPQIYDFYPKQGTWLDTITIRGKNFSRMNDQNLVKTGAYITKCIASSDTLLKVIIPESLIKVRTRVSVTVFGNTSSSINEFVLLPPEIHESTPEEGLINTIVTLIGKNFHPQAKVYFDDKPGDVISASNTKILVRVPAFSDEKDVKITVDIFGQINKEDHNFKFLFPVITGFSPTGTWDDELVIYGRNLPVHERTVVVFSGSSATIIHKTEDSITVKVPRFLSGFSHFITIKLDYYQPGLPYFSQQCTSKIKFELIKPTITGFTPGQAGFGEVVEISGSHFHPDEHENIVRFGEIKAETISHSASLLKVKVPVEMQKTSAILSLQIHDYKLSAVETFKLFPLEITGLDALWFARSHPLRIYGSGFNSNPSYNNVFWGDEKLYVGQGGTGYILAGRYFDLNNEPSIDFRKVKVEVAGQMQEINYLVRYYEPWSYYHVSNHILQSINDIAFSIGDRHFIGQTNAIFEYFPSTNSVVRKANLPFEISRVEYTRDGVFTTASKAFLLHKKGFFSYDPVKDTWSKMNEFPGSLNNGVFAFKAGNDSYMMGEIVSFIKNESNVEGREVWKYNEGDDSWSKVANFPATDILKGLSFTFNGKGFVGFGGIGKIWEYDPVNEDWQEKIDISNEISYDPYYTRSVFVLNNYAYVAFTSQVYRFDLLKNTHTRIVDLPFGTRGYYAFSHNEKGYVMGGYAGSYFSVQIFNPDHLPPTLMPE